MNSVAGHRSRAQRIAWLALAAAGLALTNMTAWAIEAGGSPRPVATFSIVAADPEAEEVGVAVASRFFVVGNVVPWAKAGVGAIATQSYANTTFGPHGLSLLEVGLAPEDVLQNLLAKDDKPERRQVGIVSASGLSATHTGSDCNSWAGGRSGPNYAVQGNILTGEDVVAAMERAFLQTEGSLARRLYAALQAGEAAGGDSRGRQSAALLVARENGGYGGYTDRFIDLRVDDHADPVGELGRLLGIAEVNGLWNLAWTAYTESRYDEALPYMEKTAKAAREAGSTVLPEVLYDLAVVRTHTGHTQEALEALAAAIAANPNLADGAKDDVDLKPLRKIKGFKEALKGNLPQSDTAGG